MFELLAVIALILSLVALSRAGRAQRQAQNLAHRLELLETEVRAARLRKADVDAPRLSGAEIGAGIGAEIAAIPAHTPPAHTPPLVPEATVPGWPEDQPTFPPPAARPPAPPRPRGPSLWGPQFSRARVSLIGGVLVLGGLAFTLRALGAPAWTLLLAVFAFGGLLYFNARRVPWPVSGALRGLGYGVAALGVGSLSQRLPGAWGPGAVTSGLLLLSAALVFDALRRRELLLGALAVGGAALSTWMLTDDLGRWSIPVAGAVLLLAAVAVWQGRAVHSSTGQGRAGQDAVVSEGEDVEISPDAPASRRAALALTLGAAGAVPVGWFVASASHAEDALRFGADRGTELARATLHLSDGPLSLLPWLVFSLLALAIPLALLPRARQGLDNDSPEDRPASTDLHSTDLNSADLNSADLNSTDLNTVTLSAAWAVLAPQALVAAAVGGALGRGGFQAGALALALVILAALVIAARLAWLQRGAQDSPLANTLAGSLTAGAAGVAGALALSVLGPRTEPLALAGVAAALLLVGLYGRSRFWLRVGALGLGFTALWGMWTTLGLALGDTVFFARLADLREALLGAAPAALGLLAAWRLGRDGWATLPRQSGKVVGTAQAQGAQAEGQPQPRAVRRSTPTLLAGLCSAALGLALLAAGSAVLALGVLLAALALWLLRTDRTNTVPFWAAAPGLTLGGLLLLLNASGGRTPLLLLGVGSILLAGAALLRVTPRTFAEPSPRLITEGLALILLTLGLGRAAQQWWPALGLPGTLALLAVLTAPLKLTLNWSRVDALLGLGGLTLLSLIMAGWPGEDGATYGATLNRPLVAALGAAALAAAWWLTRTAGGLRVLSTLTRPFGGLPSDAAPHPPVARALWLGAWALLLPLALGARLSTVPADLRPWLPVSSLALLAVGLITAAQAHRAGGTPWARTLWTVGLALIAGAGVKGALLDAAYFPNPSAGLGIAVLVTGLSLLAVAILAPRPAAPAGLVEERPGGPLE